MVHARIARTSAGLTTLTLAGALVAGALVAPARATTAAAPAATAVKAGTAVPGLYGASDPTYDGVYRQSLAILGLHTAGIAPRPEAIAFLERQQCADGGFSSYNPDPSKPCPAFDAGTFTGGEDTNATAAAVQALLAIGETSAAKKAATWLVAQQNADGGWEYTAGQGGSDPNSTGLVLMALSAAGVTPKDSPKSGLDYVASLQAGRADFAGTPAADRGGIASPWSAGAPDLLATVQAVPGIRGADLTTVPGGTTWRDNPAAPPASAPAATVAGVSSWATTWLAAQADDDAISGGNAAWAILAFAWERRAETTAHALYDGVVKGKVPATDPGANGQAALAAAALGLPGDVRSYAKAIEATLQKDVTGPVSTVVVPAKAKKASSWKKIRVNAVDATTSVAAARVAVNLKRGGKWYAFDGSSWNRGKARTWLAAKGSGTAFSLKVKGLTVGKLVVRAKATDAVGNTGAVAKHVQKLTKK